MGPYRPEEGPIHVQTLVEDERLQTTRINMKHLLYLGRSKGASGFPFPGPPLCRPLKHDYAREREAMQNKHKNEHKQAKESKTIQKRKPSNVSAHHFHLTFAV